MQNKKEIKKKVGKPTFYTEPMERVNVMLDHETIAFYKQAGAGNLSEGIRKSWRGLTTACTGLAPTAAQDEQGSTGASQ